MNHKTQEFVTLHTVLSFCPSTMAGRSKGDDSLFHSLGCKASGCSERHVLRSRRA